MTDPKKTAAMPLAPLPSHPMVSIITVNRNHGDFLEETILSVLKQDYPHIEHIVIDGASTDKSIEILKRYEKDPRIRWVSEHDEGNDQATLKGMQMARGDLMGVQNSTDTYQPGALREAVQEFLADPSLAMVGGRVYTIDNHGKMTRGCAEPASLEERRILSFEDIASFNYPAMQSAFFRRDLARETGWYLGEMNWHSCHTIFFLHYLLEAWKRGARALYLPGVWGTFRAHEKPRHRALSTFGLGYYLERRQACEFNAERYKNDLTREEIRLLRRWGHYFVYYYRVVNLHQILRAVPSFLCYLWYGGRKIPAPKALWKQMMKIAAGDKPKTKDKKEAAGTTDTRWYFNLNER